MNTTNREVRMLADDIMDYVFEKIEERLKEFKIEFKKELEGQNLKQTEEILIATNKILERLIK